MGRLKLEHLVYVVTLAVPIVAGAQTVSPAFTTTAVQAAGSQTKPQEPAPAPATDTAAEEPRSLFEPTWRQFQIGGRFSSVDGDPARFQRYQDIRDGLLFTDAKYAKEGPDGAWLFRATADNVGWRDQRFFADYERTGKFVISGLWNEIPQFYSVDTATPYTASADGQLVLDDATQRRIQQGQYTPPLSGWLPLASQFELRERRDVGKVSFVATPTPELDVKAGFTMNRHVGELPWGASFGFSNDVEVALPYDSRTNDFNVGTEWTNGKNMVRVAYDGSWFNNLDDTLVWDSPLRIDDAVDNPARGRMSLWPTNSAQTFSVGGFSKFAHRTQVTGFLSLGFWNNDQPLQPFTINTVLPQFALPRSNTDGEARVFSTNVNLVSRPATDWRVSARVRHYGYDNNSPQTSITDYITYDSDVGTSPIGGPRLYAHSRTNFDADATYTGFAPLALTAGYSRNNTGYDFRVFDSTGENVLHLTADAVGSQWVSFRAQYELAGRSGSGLNEDLLVQTGEQAAMRHYDVANRSRNRFTGQVDLTPNELWTFSVSTGLGKDNFDDSYFGLQESSVRTFSLGADVMYPNGFGGGASYNYERYTGFQTSRSASSGSELTDPRRDWTTDSAERVHYFSIYATPPRIGRNTEARLSYDYSHAEGSYVYGVVPGGPLATPSQLPNVFNKLQQLHVDVRHRLSNRLAATVSYLYEPFRVYDFAFDQSVVNSIVQPSSLVLGYVYRPYTAHAFNVGLRYFW